MSYLMKALVIEGPRSAVIRELPIPQAGPGELVIRIKRAGICGTDLHIYEGDYFGTYPIIPGHEFAGEVYEVGEGVEQFAPGDRISADPNIQCGQCRHCVAGRANHCEHLAVIGVTMNGAMAEYMKLPAAIAVRLPERLSDAECALVEPAACVVQGIRRARPLPGESALLFGAGAMGQQWIQALAASGIGELTVVDLAEPKLHMAAQWGATRTLNAVDAAAALADRTGSNGYDIVIDTTGVAQVIQQALAYIGPCGRFIQFGVTGNKDTISLPTFDLYRYEWSLIGSMALNRTFDPALAWFDAGRLSLGHLVSRELTLKGALDYLRGDRRQDDLKVQIAF